MKIVTIGGGCQDIYLHFEGTDTMSIRQQQCLVNYLLFKSGQKIEIDSLAYLTGGGATNAAVSFSRLGIEADVLCSLGSDQAGKLIKEELSREGVSITLIQNSNKHTGVSFIVKSDTGERTILVHRGANSNLNIDKLTNNDMTQYDFIYITSLSQAATKYLPQLTRQAKELNIPVAINPGSSQLKHDTLTLKQSLRYIDILILNSSEAQTFMLALAQSDESYNELLKAPQAECIPCSPNQKDETPYLMQAPMLSGNLYFSLRSFFKTVLSLGPRIVVVTNGCNGVYAASQNKIYFHPAIKIDVIDNVGAGDSFGSCFVSSLLSNASIEDALRNGIVNSAAVLSKIGAKTGLLTKKQLQEKVKNINKNLLKTFDL